MNNDEILNELFFDKKKSFSDQLKEKQAQYTPVKDNSKGIKQFFNGKSLDTFVVSDIDSVKKNIVSALGMAAGTNTIKSMANKAIKNFPIIVSDDVSPETVVMAKTMMEEQYASYIDLLVSNQIINIADYQSNSENGNIAIQALNKLNGADFGTGRLTRQAAQTGSVTVDDLMQNNPGWQFIRANENAEFVSGNPILDCLLEDAIIVNSCDAQKTANVLYEEMINEAHATPLSAIINSDEDSYTDSEITAAIKATGAQLNQSLDAGDYFVNKHNDQLYRRNNAGVWTKLSDQTKDEPQKRLDLAIQDVVRDNDADLYKKYGISIGKSQTTYDAAYEKLLTPSIFVDKDGLNKALDRSIGEILTGSGRNVTEKEKRVADILRDKFEKASFLLAERRIAGSEYISYVTVRLGLPMSDNTRKDILLKYKSNDVIISGVDKDDAETIKRLHDNIAHNKRDVLNIVTNTCGLSARQVLGTAAVGGILGTGIGGGAVAGAISAGVTATSALILPWVVLPAIVGAAGAGLAAAVVSYFKKSKKRTANHLYGWERVEALIDEMEATRADVIKHANDIMLQNDTDANKISSFKNEEDALFSEFASEMKKIMAKVSVNEEIVRLDPYISPLSEEQLRLNLETLQGIDDCLDEETIYETYSLNEAAKYIINTKKPGDIIVKQTKYDSKNVASMIPTFGTRDVVAYGSVEYDRRDIRDRKFNEPLILTIKFKERYSDGSYNDNELTAVIGILGVVTRVPSDEMCTILRSNAEGKTLKDFFKGDEANNSKELIGNMISNFMGSKMAEKLPTSGKIWNDLSKVSMLAVSNKLAGGNNGNISNAHLVFSQREIDIIKNELGIDYLKNPKLSAQLMKKYAAFMLVVCNDAMQYIYTYSDPDSISWDDAPYSAYMGKSNTDQFLSAFTQYNRMKL